MASYTTLAYAFVSLVLMTSHEAYGGSSSCTTSNACTTSDNPCPLGCYGTTPASCPPGTTFEPGPASVTPNPAPLCCCPPIDYSVTFECSWTCVPDGSGPDPPDPPTADPCQGLTTVTGPALKYRQVVVSPEFAPFVTKLAACATGNGFPNGLDVVTSGRCENLGPGKRDDHQVGRAIDANLLRADGSDVSAADMYNAWCAYHQTDKNCKNNKTPQNTENENINNFFLCAISAGFNTLGAQYSSPGFAKKEGDHFDWGPPPTDAETEAFKALLQKYCNNQCPNIPQGTYVDPDACKCF